MTTDNLHTELILYPDHIDAIPKRGRMDPLFGEDFVYVDSSFAHRFLPEPRPVKATYLNFGETTISQPEFAFGIFNLVGRIYNENDETKLYVTPDVVLPKGWDLFATKFTYFNGNKPVHLTQIMDNQFSFVYF